MTVLNFGSLNIDHVYRVEHVVRPGETLVTSDYRVFAGGKGANQSAALALAGAAVSHAGRVGADGQWLLDGLVDLGVDVSHVVVDDQSPTGHAVIQVEARSGQNAIFLFAGCNHRIQADQVEAVLSKFEEGDILLLQNEINNIPVLIREGSTRGLCVCLNPAPYTPEVAAYPLDRVDLLVVNQTEAAGLAGADGGPSCPVEQLLDQLRGQVGRRPEVLLTLGAGGAVLDAPGGRTRVEAFPAPAVVDTTAAGDTFIGYFLASRAAGHPDGRCLRRAAAAAALCVSRSGARSSIPRAGEVDRILQA